MTTRRSKLRHINLRISLLLHLVLHWPLSRRVLSLWRLTLALRATNMHLWHLRRLPLQRLHRLMWLLLLHWLMLL